MCLQKLDMTQHQMLYEGPLTWRINRTKQIDLHVVLLEHILVLLQRQDERLVLRCQSTTVVAGREGTKYHHSPIIKLSNLLTRSVATGRLIIIIIIIIIIMLEWPSLVRCLLLTLRLIFVFLYRFIDR